MSSLLLIRTVEINPESHSVNLERFAFLMMHQFRFLWLSKSSSYLQVHLPISGQDFLFIFNPYPSGKSIRQN